MVNGSSLLPIGSPVMRVAIGANHNGYRVRQMLIEMLGQSGHEVIDLGVSGPKPVNYPDIAASVAELVAGGKADRGILITGTGLGVCIAANKVPGVRAVPCQDAVTAKVSRSHNDSNVLCLSAALLGHRLICHIVETWLKTPFDGGRHQCRLAKIAELDARASPPRSINAPGRSPPCAAAPARTAPREAGRRPSSSDARL